jgi:hypothetical protein
MFHSLFINSYLTENGGSRVLLKCIPTGQMLVGMWVVALNIAERCINFAVFSCLFRNCPHHFTLADDCTIKSLQVLSLPSHRYFQV